MPFPIVDNLYDIVLCPVLDDLNSKKIFCVVWISNASMIFCFIITLKKEFFMFWSIFEVAEMLNVVAHIVKTERA